MSRVSTAAFPFFLRLAHVARAPLLLAPRSRRSPPSCASLTSHPPLLTVDEQGFNCCFPLLAPRSRRCPPSSCASLTVSLRSRSRANTPSRASSPELPPQPSMDESTSEFYASRNSSCRSAAGFQRYEEGGHYWRARVLLREAHYYSSEKKMVLTTTTRINLSGRMFRAATSTDISRGGLAGTRRWEQ
jgi:hypothetical protein